MLQPLINLRFRSVLVLHDVRHKHRKHRERNDKRRRGILDVAIYLSEEVQDAEYDGPGHAEQDIEHGHGRRPLLSGHKAPEPLPVMELPVEV